MTELSIRPFLDSDLPMLHSIRIAAFVGVFASFRGIMGPDIAKIAMRGAEDEQTALLNGFTASDDNRELLVACLDGQPIGFAALTFDPVQAIGEIVITAIDPAHSGQGHGTTLNLAALSRMKQRGMRVATVGTGGDPSHAAARRTYEKAGFSKVIPNLVYYQALQD